MKPAQLGSIAAKLFAAAMLCGTLLYRSRDYFTLVSWASPATYFSLLRWVVCPVVVFTALQAADLRKRGWVVALAFVALLFNPLFPVHLKRETWAVIDVGVAVALLISIAALDRNKQPTP